MRRAFSGAPARPGSLSATSRSSCARLATSATVAPRSDTETAVAKRLAEFHTQTKPVLDLFARKELIVTVDGTRTIEEVQGEIHTRLGLPPLGELDSTVLRALVEPAATDGKETS